MLIPEKPIKAIAISPAVIRAMGIPLNGFGGSANLSLALTPANMTIAIVNPTAAENPKATDSAKVYPS